MSTLGLNTYKEAAAKLRVSSRSIQTYVAKRWLAVVDIGHRTKFITDLELNRFIVHRTRNSRFHVR